ncbi:helix-turn-helix domain-containing protein [Altererythrobacter sp. H2]|uniref:helix-turn-helix domain-containing protein n=1 Tax=Altererythrobacter sp. H2 TaxID=3108391 RepID=UPI002B4BB3C9|nr:helix-turn-helix domain-containing protein [Altererythrobacter sp. H2]WRK95599.1 helix-turn-helix domain-containing protein [Altererythrobacter sp. H2]
MTEDNDISAEQLPLDNTGQRLRRAREAAGMTAEQVAAETRIPLRHIETIERGDFASLPSRTYAMGFSRTYAKAVGLDDKEVGAQLRAELGHNPNDRPMAPRYEPGDPARVPSRGLAWLSALAAVLLLIGGFAFYRSYWAPGSGPAPLDEPAEQAAPVDPAASPAPGAGAAAGQVVFTSLEDGVWVKFYDASGAQLMQKQMALNERYVLPADAEGPQIWTGRPDALRITVDGKPVPKLSDSETVVKDMPVSAQDLLARGGTSG